MLAPGVPTQLSCFRITCCTLLASLGLLFAAQAHADANKNPFGAKGQIVPLAGATVGLQLGAGAAGTDGLGRDVSINISPGMLYFFAQNLLCGFGVDFNFIDRELPSVPYSEVDFGASVAFGAHVPFGEALGLLPRLWVGAGYMRRSYMDADFPRRFNDPTYFSIADIAITEGPYLSVQLLAPFAFQLARATFISLGPNVRLQWAIEHGTRSLDYGVYADIGRYF